MNQTLLDFLTLAAGGIISFWIGWMVAQWAKKLGDLITGILNDLEEAQLMARTKEAERLVAKDRPNEILDRAKASIRAAREKRREELEDWWNDVDDEIEQMTGEV